MRIDRVKITALMKQKELKQYQLANLIDVSRTTINAICCGRSCTDETAERIAAALGVRIEDIKEEIA